MIFLSVGTILPFDRLVRAVDDWALSTGYTEIFGQLGELGPDNYRPKAFPWREMLTPKEFRQQIEEAEVVVSHAGIGTIIDCLSRSKPIVVMARHSELREIVNDHQLETIRALHSRSGVFVAEEPSKLGNAIATALSAHKADKISEYAQESLITAVRDAIHGKF